MFKWLKKLIRFNKFKAAKFALFYNLLKNLTTVIFLTFLYVNQLFNVWLTSAYHIKLSLSFIKLLNINPMLICLM